MELQEYHKLYYEDVKSTAASEGDGNVPSFTKLTCENFVENQVFEEYEQSYFEGASGRKKCRVDAWSYNEFDKTLVLIASNYSQKEEIETLTKTEANQLFKWSLAFFEECINEQLDIEISTPAFDLSKQIQFLWKKEELNKIKLFVITDKIMSKSIGIFPNSKFKGIPLEYHIWDIQRLERLFTEGEEGEPIEVDFLELYGKGLPTLEACDVNVDGLKFYLCVLSGDLLADIYDKFGSRLLEGNVRSFLSTKVAVNRDIRKTILSDEKNMFFSYNNGIAATANEVDIDKTETGILIKKINNLQVVNGGQTTASLSNARFKDKTSLENIYVQMKLTVIPDKKTAEKIIPNISRYSNSQNKVSSADFFSNHEFNIQMEKLSRRLFAPAKDGAQYETIWFFERVRGQFEQEQRKMTPAKKRQYILQHPKDQRLNKTDMAKLRDIWRELPNIVSWGAQKNCMRFAEYIDIEWMKNKDNFNELYYKDTIALRIIFNYLDKNIAKQVWYEKGYKANIVTYAMSWFKHLVEKQYPQKTFDLQKVWKTQELTDALKLQLLQISEYVSSYITDDAREVLNVTEWCKKENCWTCLKEKSFEIDKEAVKGYLISIGDAKDIAKIERKVQKMVNGIEAQKQVVGLGVNYWKKIATWGLDKNLFSPKEMSLLKTAIEMEIKLPTEKQCASVLEIKGKSENEGFTYS
ncbi:AIPR protein [Acetobacterium paludosum]|uniref:AIPR protein n=1 Tax=Acetobacterium paludosum TaxID=52693 RepID=A0A923HSC1_9FIRM|nr:AIPR family protein [Acetobacterium paludosum]MBC3887804.1 AIPR protein [Acetobacterium paludosum]